MPANGTSDMAAAEVKPTVKGLNRTEALASIMQDPVWDVVVVGGGATGAGVALAQNAASGSAGFFRRNLVALDKADPRRRALFKKSQRLGIGARCAG